MRNNPESPIDVEHIDVRDPLVNIQARTRDKIFRNTGKVVEIGTDAFVFGAQAGGYTVGKIAHGTATGVWETLKGAFNKPFKRAA